MSKFCDPKAQNALWKNDQLAQNLKYQNYIGTMAQLYNIKRSPCQSFHVF